MKIASNSVALLLALTTVSAYDVPNLTQKNFVDTTDGKIVFIKFFATRVSSLYSPGGQLKYASVYGVSKHYLASTHN